MTWLRDYQIKLKDHGSGSILIQHVQRIVNNNKNPASWTEEERNNPVIFDKQIQTFITISMSIVKNKESGTVLSGGNFDFKNTSDSSYLLELRYIDNNEALKEVVKAVRDGCGFSCIPGHNSTSCFLPDPNASTAENDSKLQEVFDVLDERLGALKKN